MEFSSFHSDYKIVEAYDSTELSKKVVEEIRNGWVPYGNLVVQILPSNGACLYIQAMVKP